MKKMYEKLVLLGIMACPFIGMSQVTQVGNAGGGATDYVGWSSSEPFPLEIRHNGSENMAFVTDSIQRMIIKGDGTNDGFVGIGTASPAYLLDVYGNMNLDTFNFIVLVVRRHSTLIPSKMLLWVPCIT